MAAALYTLVSRINQIARQLVYARNLDYKQGIILRVRLIGFCLLALMGCRTPALGAEAFEAYRERTSMLLLASHCKALSPLEKAALLSGQVQARGTLLRGGEDPQTLDALLLDLSRRAKVVSCDRDDVKAEIARMQDAARLWTHLNTMRFPSRWQNWEARRDDAREKPRWRVRVPLRDSSGALLDFGLVADGEKVFLDLVVLDGKAPASVILHMRDTNRLATPMNAEMLRLMGRTGDSPENLMPPQSVVHSFFAADKMPAPYSLIGEPEKKSTAVLFRFKDKALDAFSALDPRDVVALELVYPRQAGVRKTRQRIYAEAGDFAAARLFAQTFPEEPKPTN